MSNFCKIGKGTAVAVGVYLLAAASVQKHSRPKVDAFVGSDCKDTVTLHSIIKSDSIQNAKMMKAHEKTCNWCKACDLIHRPLNFLKKIK